MISEREIILQKQRTENALEIPDFQGFRPFSGAPERIRTGGLTLRSLVCSISRVAPECHTMPKNAVISRDLITSSFLEYPTESPRTTA